MRDRRRQMAGVGVLLAGGLALVAADVAGRQQPKGEPFTTAILKVKDGLRVIPGYDGVATGGNVAVRVTSEGAEILMHRIKLDDLGRLLPVG